MKYLFLHIEKIRLFLAGAVVLAIFGLAALPVGAQPSYFAAEDATGEACKALGEITPGSSPGTDCEPAEGRTLDKLIKLALQMLSLVAGVIAVIMIIVSGLKYMTADGDATQISNAKKSLIYALVGLVVVALSQVIVQFVLGKSLNA